MKGKTIRKILLTLLISIVLILTGIFFCLPVLLNNRITSYINDHTEFSIKINTVSFTGYHSLALEEITFRHKQDKEEYIRHKGFQTDWIAVKARSVSITGIHWKKLLFDKSFYAEKLIITDPGIYAFRDKRIPAKYAYKALPAALLRKAAAAFTIPVTEIINGKIVYEEVTQKTQQNIKVPFSNLYATIYHTSSDSVYLLAEPVMTIDAQAMVFDSIKTAVTYTANTLNKKNVFTLEGNMGSFPARLLNQCITPATHVMIESGQVNRIRFKLTANENVANGTISMDYDNLKLKVLKKDGDNTTEKKPGEGKMKKSGTKTFLANLFVRNKNKKQTQPGEKIRENLPAHAPLVDDHTGAIHFERRKDRFIFNYWWNAFKSGVVSTVVKVPVEKTQK